MRNPARLVLCAASLIAVSMQPSFGGDAEDAAEIADRIRLLGADDFRLREAAAEGLAKLGAKAREPMKTALSATDNPEIARRLEGVLALLDEDRIRNATKITWKVERKPVKEIIQTVADMAGCRVRFQEVPEKMLLSFDWVEMPLLQVFDRIADASGYSVVPSDDEFNRFVVHNSDVNVSVASFAGPFRIGPNVITVNRQLQLGNIPRNQPGRQIQESLILNLTISSEPKLPMTAIGAPVILKAVDDRGQSLVELPPEGTVVEGDVDAENMVASYRSHSMHLGFALGRSNRAAEKIRILKGRVPVRVLIETRTLLTIDKLSEAKGKAFDTRSCTIDIGEVTFANPGTVQVTVRRKGHPDDTNWAQSIWSCLQFYDADGSRLICSANADARNSPNSVAATAQLQRLNGRNALNPRPVKPTRLVFVEWVTKQRVVEFELKDIPLP